MHLSAHEDGRQLASLDLHTKRHRPAPTKAIRKVFCGYQAHANKDMMMIENRVTNSNTN